MTRLILVNAVYFKGAWVNIFDARNTEDEDFHVSPSETVKVKMMYRTEAKFYYGENEDLKCQAIELPYNGDCLSMFILLPDHSKTSLAEVEKRLTFDDLVNVKQKFEMSLWDVILWLPKFKMDVRLSLSESLCDLGMSDLFQEGVADLSGLDGSKELYVSKVLHRAMVDVNEQGTEAGACTAEVQKVLYGEIPKEMEFHADHPFLFFIQHKPTGSILFLGRLAKPPAA